MLINNSLLAKMLPVLYCNFTAKGFTAWLEEVTISRTTVHCCVSRDSCFVCPSHAGYCCSRVAFTNEKGAWRWMVYRECVYSVCSQSSPGVLNLFGARDPLQERKSTKDPLIIKTQIKRKLTTICALRCNWNYLHSKASQPEYFRPIS